MDRIKSNSPQALSQIAEQIAQDATLDDAAYAQMRALGQEARAAVTEVPDDTIT